jgi:hypothetical protein
MMRLVRFMSAHEAFKLLDGAVIKNTTDHRRGGARSSSVGACFAIVTDSDDVAAIYKTAKYLSGIVTMDTCIIATLKEPQPEAFTQGRALYSAGHLDEMCATAYSRDNFDSWKLYTPQLPPVQQMIKVISSFNWRTPVLTKESA